MSDLLRDISTALKHYDKLQLVKKGNRFFIEGKFTCVDQTGDLEIETYELRIEFPANYPYCFPRVFETGGKIPRGLDRHINIQGSMCFAAPQEELAICHTGITLIWFCREILNTHLCREYVRETTGVYPTGERSHGEAGIWESYFESFETNSKVEVLQQLRRIMENHGIERNDPCFCGSNKKFKKCHKELSEYIMKPGSKELNAIYKILINDFENSSSIINN